MLLALFYTAKVCDLQNPPSTHHLCALFFARLMQTAVLKALLLEHAWVPSFFHPHMIKLCLPLMSPM